MTAPRAQVHGSLATLLEIAPATPIRRVGVRHTQKFELGNSPFSPGERDVTGKGLEGGKAAGKPVELPVGAAYNNVALHAMLAKPYGLVDRAMFGQMQLTAK